MDKRVCILFVFSLFVDDRDVKTKVNIKQLKRMLSFNFEIVSFKLFNSYLPNHLERSHEEKYCE